MSGNYVGLLHYIAVTVLCIPQADKDLNYPCGLISIDKSISQKQWVLYKDWYPFRMYAESALSS